MERKSIADMEGWQAVFDIHSTNLRKPLIHPFLHQDEKPIKYYYEHVFESLKSLNHPLACVCDNQSGMKTFRQFRQLITTGDLL